MTTVKEWWKEEWPNLKEQPECSASSDSCWICDELVKWNVALTNFAIRLSESSLGKICLTIDVTLPATNLQQLEDTAAITVWLLKKHRCIETFQIGRLNNQDQVSKEQRQSGSFGNVTVPKPVAEVKSSLRHISIGGHAPDNWASLLDAIGPIENLESLTLLHIHASPASAKKLAELLAANEESVRKVYVEGFMCSDSGGGGIAELMDATARRQNIEEDAHDCDVLMEGIAKCRNLMELVYRGELGTDGLRSLEVFLRSNRTLRIFWLPPKERAQFAFFYFIRENRTLTELDLSCEDCEERSINVVLTALQNHNTLERLTIHGGLQNSNQLELNSLISKNRSIRSLTIRDASIFFDFGKLIAEGLSKNTTLECLDISECYVDFQSVQTLCDALTTNMCSVKFGCLEPPQINRPANENHPFYLNRYWATLKDTRQMLATKLREENLYGRVQLEWSDYDASGLAASLRFRTIDLELDTAKLTEESFASVCTALSSSVLVCCLTVRLSKGKSEYVEALSDALRENVSLKIVKLIENSQSSGMASKVAQGLRYNTKVAYLGIECNDMNPEGAEQLRDMIAENRSLNRIDLSVVSTPLSPECLDILSEGVVQNPFIISFAINNVHKDADLRQIHLTLMGNSVCLNRAVRFVLRPNPEKPWAEAFKLFQAQTSLIERVKEESGKSDSEAKVAVTSSAGKPGTCGVDHEEKFIPCAAGVVYEVPLLCGRSYIGQTGRCVNERLRQHKQENKLRQHSCRNDYILDECEPEFSNTKILAKHIDKLTREYIEAYHITKNGNNCISSIFPGTCQLWRRGTQLK